MSRAAQQRPVVVVGAGIGGLAAAVDLARAGEPVLVLEAAAAAGGKVAALTLAGREVACGPTVLTMRWVFDALFADAGADFAAAVQPERLARLARHVWPDGSQLDLAADTAAATEQVGDFAGAAAARGFAAFTAYAERLYEAARPDFIAAPRPSLGGVLARGGLAALGRLGRIDATRSMHRALQGYFADPRLLQLFGRYATYCGGSPYQTPATFNLVAHVERQGVWRLPGGMPALARALLVLAMRHGAARRMDATVRRLTVAGGRVSGVELADGSTVAARAVVLNGGAAELAALCGRRPPAAATALTAHTWSAVARCAGRPLAYHTVLFGPDPRAEFAAIFARGEAPARPTIYICAQDRDGDGPPASPERLFCLTNAPTGAGEDGAWPERLRAELQSYGVEVTAVAAARHTAPRDFAQRFPATRGALYGPPPHGLMMLLRRPGSRTPIPGVHLCGATVHPGPGVPMVALSGRLAAAAHLRASASTSRSRPAATPGGTSTPRATTAATR